MTSNAERRDLYGARALRFDQLGRHHELYFSGSRRAGPGQARSGLMKLRTILRQLTVRTGEQTHDD